MASAAPALLLLLSLPVTWAIAAAEVPSAQAPSQKDITLLTARVANVLASEEHLMAENAELKLEVEGWERVGKKVMNREARIVNAITQAQGAATSEPSLRAAVIAGLSEEHSQMQPLALSDTKSAEPLPSLLVSWQLFVLAITAFFTAAFCWLRAPLSALLSQEKIVELSELQLQGVPAAFGDAYLLVQPSDGLRSRTRVAQQGQSSSVLRFDNEDFNFSVRKSSGPCTISIFRRGELQDERIGAASLEASALLDAPGRGSQYFYFKVHPESLASAEDLLLAMRIREISSDLSKPGAGRTKRAGDAV